MVLLLFGPPGCGKGTQSPLLRDRLGIPALSTGDMLRRESSAGSELGVEIGRLLAAGQLVPDAVVNGLLAARLAEPDCRDGFLIDGYPRTVEQAVHLGRVLRELGHPAPVLIHLDVPEEVLLRRLTARWCCPRCNTVYNLVTRPPRQPGLCDHDFSRLCQRQDDTMATAMERLEAYWRLTNPVLEYFTSTGAGQVLPVDANHSPDAVFAEIRSAIETQVLIPSRLRPRAI
ncbi:MAG: nucleoside monophosphate kinase [Bryobacter sp.]|nr:nucleoside monophosphate kinase [Bryobacter sp. CoA8 C33]